MKNQLRNDSFLRELKHNRFFDDLNYIFQKIQEESKKRRVKIILVINPRSTQARRAKKEILEPLNQFIFEQGGTKKVTVLKYEIQPTNVDENARGLAKMLSDDDIMITIGGDGTATIGLNAVLLSCKQVKYYTVPYGNFNDIARTVRAARGGKVFLLEALLDGEHFRYALCYFTVGMLAKSTEIFDETRIRERLRKKRNNLFFSLFELFKWFLINHKTRFIPDFTYRLIGSFKNNKDLKQGGVKKNYSDMIILNGVSMAKIMRGGEYYRNRYFLVKTGRMQNIFSIGWFMIRSILFKVPGEKVEGCEFFFKKEDSCTIEIQAEGEYKKFSNVEKIEFRKVKEALQIL